MASRRCSASETASFAGEMSRTLQDEMVQTMAQLTLKSPNVRNLSSLFAPLFLDETSLAASRRETVNPSSHLMGHGAGAEIASQSDVTSSLGICTYSAMTLVRSKSFSEADGSTSELRG